MAPPTHLHPLVMLFRTQTRGIEDAVLTLLGEQALETAEDTEPGAPGWGGLEPLRLRTPSAPLQFFARRSADELPWSTFEVELAPR